MNTFVCGTDFTPQAQAAGDVAAALAARLGGTLHLVHVLDAGADLMIGSLADPLYEPVREQLRAEAQRLRQSGAKVAEDLRAGAADEEIVDVASRQGAGMVILGALGRRGSSRWRIGSVAERVSASAPMPVLIVRAADALVAWAAHGRTLRVAVGADFTPTAETAVRWAEQLRTLGRIELVLLHAAPGAGADQQGVLNALSHGLAVRVSELPGEPRPHVIVRPARGHVADRLAALTAETGADLLVVGTHQRHGLARVRHGSVSAGVIALSSSSVAVIPIPARPDVVGPTLPRLRRVVAPTDLSDLGNRAVPFACALTGAGGTLVLAHVVAPGRGAEGLADLASRLRDLAAGVTHAHQIELRTAVVEGDDVAGSIVETARRYDGEAICMSTHGQSGTPRGLAGSVAQEVLRRTELPILVVRPPA